MPEQRRLDRKAAIGAGVAGLAAIVVGCSDEAPAASGTTDGPDPHTSSRTPASTPETRALTPADFGDTSVCELSPEQTEGPFYLSADLLRSDIREGRPGEALRVGFQVVDGRCAPVPEAIVDLWHADHTGDYSAFADGSPGEDQGEGTTFLRGSQQASVDGIVEFTTIFPGWYPGRTVHLHVKVRRGRSELLTTQAYFPEDVLDDVFARAPYSERGPRDTSNASDGLFTDGDGARTIMTLRANPVGEGRLALLRLGLQSTG